MENLLPSKRWRAVSGNVNPDWPHRARLTWPRPEKGHATPSMEGVRLQGTWLPPTCRFLKRWSIATSAARHVGGTKLKNLFVYVLAVAVGIVVTVAVYSLLIALDR